MNLLKRLVNEKTVHSPYELSAVDSSRNDGRPSENTAEADENGQGPGKPAEHLHQLWANWNLSELDSQAFQ